MWRCSETQRPTSCLANLIMSPDSEARACSPSFLAANESQVADRSLRRLCPPLRLGFNNSTAKHSCESAPTDRRTNGSHGGGLVFFSSSSDEKRERLSTGGAAAASTLRPAAADGDPGGEERGEAGGDMGTPMVRAAGPTAAMATAEEDEPEVEMVSAGALTPSELPASEPAGESATSSLLTASEVPSGTVDKALAGLSSLRSERSKGGLRKCTDETIARKTQQYLATRTPASRLESLPLRSSGTC